MLAGSQSKSSDCHAYRHYYSKTPDEHPPRQQHPLLSSTFSRDRLFFLFMIYKSTPDEQHPSNATSNSILVNKMAKVPLISNTFLGVAWGAFLGQSPTMYSGFCKRAANHGPAWLWLLQTSWCGGLQAMIGLVFGLLVPHKCKRAELVAWHSWG